MRALRQLRTLGLVALVLSCSKRGDDCKWNANCGPYPDPPANGGEAGAAGAAGAAAEGGAAGSIATAGATGAGGEGGDAGQGGAGGAGGAELPEAIFVAPTGSAEASGSADDPLSSITEALAAAEASGLGRVIVCNATYDEQVVITGGVTVQGGYACPDTDTPWAVDATARAVVAPSEPGFALVVENVDAPVLIERMRFRAQDAVEPGGSSIAAFVAGSSDVTLRDARLVAGDGADGENRSLVDYEFEAPLDGNDGSETAGGGFVQCECPGGGVTSGGGGGNPAPSGQDGSDGEPDLNAGAAGVAGEPCAGLGTGGDGADGICPDPAPGARVHGSLDENGWTPGDGADGQDGSPGQGGGGGASVDTSGGGGGGGCGGCGGAGARAGRGGGSSIALLIFESTVVVEASELVTGNAGSGGQGQAGQAGQQEVGLGGNRFGAACNGGNGGPGGDGGASGGGAGGVSVGLLYSGGREPVVTDAAFALGEPGDGGLGGDPGNNDGVAGVAGDVRELMGV